MKKKKKSKQKKTCAGNLTPITNYFKATPNKTKTNILSSSNFYSSDASPNIDPCDIAGYLECEADNNWQDGRSDDNNELEKLLDLAPIYEKELWNLQDFDTEGHPLKPLSNNFQDIYGLYNALSPNLSRLSSDEEIRNAYKSCQKDFRKASIKCHPDKNEHPGSKKIWEELCLKRDLFEKANSTFFYNRKGWTIRSLSL